MHIGETAGAIAGAEHVPAVLRSNSCLGTESHRHACLMVVSRGHACLIGTRVPETRDPIFARACSSASATCSAGLVTSYQLPQYTHLRTMPGEGGAGRPPLPPPGSPPFSTTLSSPKQWTPAARSKWKKAVAKVSVTRNFIEAVTHSEVCETCRTVFFNNHAD